MAVRIDAGAKRRSGRRRSATLLALLLAALATCTPRESPQLTPFPALASPEIRIGLALGASTLELRGDSGLTLLDDDGAPASRSEPGAGWKLRLGGSRVVAQDERGWQIAGRATLTFVPRDSGGLVALNGKWYRGRITVARSRAGLTAVNLLPIEEYLASVVGAELGRRDSAELEAVAAQAIVSRTFAVRNLGKRAAEGFDLVATVTDQAYGGVLTESPLTREAVTRTAGQVLTWQGTPIDAFFFSTCAGRTAAGTEVFAAADRPYLMSVRDLDGAGEPFCRISPRFRWREEWTAGQLEEVLRQSLPAVTGITPDRLGPVRRVEVVRRTPSDRVNRVAITLGRATADVDGPAIRQVLHPVGEVVLRSAIFQLLEAREAGHLVRLTAEGAGAGHGVGLCQWGAVGRARAGQDAPMILGAYFPGTILGRAY